MNTAEITHTGAPSVRNALPAPTFNDPDAPLWGSLYPAPRSPLKQALWALVPSILARPCSGIWPAPRAEPRSARRWAVAGMGGLLTAAIAYLSAHVAQGNLGLAGENSKAPTTSSASSPPPARIGTTNVEPALARGALPAPVPAPGMVPTGAGSVGEVARRTSAEPLQRSSTQTKRTPRAKKRARATARRPRPGQRASPQR